MERADVYVGQRLAGTLDRHPDRAVFRYDAGYRNKPGSRGAISASLPISLPSHSFVGANALPYFANLLPEGWRHTVLTQSIKASADDYFRWLLAVGQDCIGDVAICSPGGKPRDTAPEFELGDRPFAFAAVLDSVTKQLRARGRGAAVPGVQEKVSSQMVSLPVQLSISQHAFRRWRSQPAILKLSPAAYPALVNNEAYFMQLARACGIETADTLLLRDHTGEYGLLVARFDRAQPQDGAIARLPQEDICQVLGRFPADKYAIHGEAVFDALAHTRAPMVQRLRLLERFAFAYVIANGDMHAKNISLWQRGGAWSLAPAYDMLSTLPYGDAHMAIKFAGRDAKFKRTHFVALGERFGLRERAVTQLLDRLLKRLEAHAQSAEHDLSTIGLTPRKTAHLARTMSARARDLA